MLQVPALPGQAARSGGEFCATRDLETGTQTRPARREVNGLRPHGAARGLGLLQGPAGCCVLLPGPRLLLCSSVGWVVSRSVPQMSPGCSLLWEQRLPVPLCRAFGSVSAPRWCWAGAVGCWWKCCVSGLCHILPTAFPQQAALRDLHGSCPSADQSVGYCRACDPGRRCNPVSVCCGLCTQV